MKLLILTIISFFALNLAYGAGITQKIPADTLQVGTASAANKRFVFNRGGSNPEIRWNETSQVLQFSNDGSTFSSVGGSSGGSFNYLYNAEFRFFQRSAPTPETLLAYADATFGPDLWKVLSSGGGTETSVQRFPEVVSGSVGSLTKLKLVQNDASDRRFGLVQCLEHERTQNLVNKIVNFSFYINSASVPNVRAGIIEWQSGATDTITGDLVSAWAATPTLVASASFKNTPSDLALTASDAIKTVTATMSASHANVCVMIWSPSAEQQNDELNITQAQLTLGSAPLTWTDIAKTRQQDQYEVERFFHKDCPVDEGLYVCQVNLIQSNFSTANQYLPRILFKQEMFLTPSCCSLSTSGSTTCNRYRDNSGAGADANTSVDQVSRSGVSYITSTAPTAANNSLAMHYYCDAAMW